MSNNSEEFWTDSHGVRYYRSNASSPWNQLGPPQQGGSSHASNARGMYPADFQNTLFRGYEDQRPAFSQPSEELAQSLPALRDPTQYPLPDDHEGDFAPQRILDNVARPSAKVAGSRRPLPDPKGKGKQRAVDPPVASVSGVKRKAAAPLIPGPTENAKKPKGRLAGAPNYSLEDVNGLLDILEELLPLGGNAWNSAADEFNVWAEENGRPVRTAKSLETKFKQLVKTTKPTGDAECPPHVERAHYIDDLMCEKAGSRDLDDDEFVDELDNVIELSDTEVKNTEKKASIKTESGKKMNVKVEKNSEGPIARRQQTDRIREARPSRNANLDVLSNISNALDPHARRARDEQQSIASMQATQIFQLSSQVRETQRQLENVRTQLTDAERRCNAAERRADRAELMSTFATPHRTHSDSHSTSSRRAPKPKRRLYRQDIHYGGGGRSTRWIGGSDDDDLEVQGFYDSPGTRRYTFFSDDETPQDNDSIHPGSPFRSASSSLNNILEPGPSQSQPVSDVSITHSPHHHSSQSVFRGDEDKENIPH